MPHVPYASAVGGLMYKMCTRPEITHVVRVLRRYMSKIRKENWTILKRVFRYWHGIASYGLWMQTGLEIWIIGYLQVGMCLTFLEEKSIG
jgi:hypothetical protein